MNHPLNTPWPPSPGGSNYGIPKGNIKGVSEGVQRGVSKGPETGSEERVSKGVGGPSE